MYFMIILIKTFGNIKCYTIGKKRKVTINKNSQTTN